MEKTNILIMGTLASGSSALADMLREYRSVNVLPLEFDNFRRPGFVYDQLSEETSRDYPNVIDAETEIENFKWELVYHSSLWKIFTRKSFRKIWENDWKIKKLNDYKNSIIALYNFHFLKELNKGLKSDISYDSKIELANKWITSIGNLYPSWYQFTLFNQPLHPWEDPAIWTRVFRPFRLICVIRDPRDQLAEMVRRDICFSPFRSDRLSYGQFNITSIYGNDRKGRMRFLTDALLRRTEMLDDWKDKLDENQFLFIDFEGLALKYDAYRKIIEEFLGLEAEAHVMGKIYYNPQIAERNSIGIYRKYLNDEEIKSLSPLESWYETKINDLNRLLERVDQTGA